MNRMNGMNMNEMGLNSNMNEGVKKERGNHSFGVNNNNSSNNNNNNSNNGNDGLNSTSSNASVGGVSLNEFGLPSIFPRVDSVATKRGSFGFAALDENHNLLGFFDENMRFTNADVNTDISSNFNQNEFVSRRSAATDASFLQV